MSSTNKTPNYELPQWVETDEFKMADFNQAMSDIDSNLNLVELGLVALSENSEVKTITDWNNVGGFPNGFSTLISTTGSLNSPASDGSFLGFQVKSGVNYWQTVIRRNSSATLMWIRHSQSGVGAFTAWRQIAFV